MKLLHSELSANRCLVKLSGPLMGDLAVNLAEELNSLSKQGIKQVILDLAEVPLIDSRGLSALITGYRVFGRNAQHFRLVGLNDQARLLFDLTGFSRIFLTFEHAADAVGV
jgi:anti-sigma B factor antagonist